MKGRRKAADAGPNLSALVALHRPGADFACYTESDDCPWYCLAGERGSWHGAERVAEGFDKRANARRLLAWGLAGGAMPAGWEATPHGGNGSQSVDLAMPGEPYPVTIWRRAWGRVFPGAVLPAVLMVAED